MMTRSSKSRTRPAKGDKVVEMGQGAPTQADDDAAPVEQAIGQSSSSVQQENQIFTVIANNAVIATVSDKEEADRIAKEKHAVVSSIVIPPASEETSDGHHTFRQLYFQRMKLFELLVSEHKEHAWKTRCHEDGKPCFGGGWFLVAIDTPKGTYGYHYEDKYWDLFDCKSLPVSKPWDGYTEEDVDRLESLL